MIDLCTQILNIYYVVKPVQCMCTIKDINALEGMSKEVWLDEFWGWKARDLMCDEKSSVGSSGGIAYLESKPDYVCGQRHKLSLASKHVGSVLLWPKGRNHNQNCIKGFKWWLYVITLMMVLAKANAMDVQRAQNSARGCKGLDQSPHLFDNMPANPPIGLNDENSYFVSEWSYYWNGYPKNDDTNEMWMC